MWPRFRGSSVQPEAKLQSRSSTKPTIPVTAHAERVHFSILPFLVPSVFFAFFVSASHANDRRDQKRQTVDMNQFAGEEPIFQTKFCPSFKGLVSVYRWLPSSAVHITEEIFQRKEHV